MILNESLTENKKLQHSIPVNKKNIIKFILKNKQKTTSKKYYTTQMVLIRMDLTRMVLISKGLIEMDLIQMASMETSK